MNIREQGWECPKCQRIWAPKVAACGACNARQTLPFDQTQRPPSTGEPTRGVPRFTCGAPEWNFNGDDLSYC